MLECHHALIMFVVLCGRCRRRGANLGDALLRRPISVLQVDSPEPCIPMHTCAGPHDSTCSYSMIGVNRCYGSESVRLVLHKRTFGGDSVVFPSPGSSDLAHSQWRPHCCSILVIAPSGPALPCHASLIGLQGDVCRYAKGSER